jgi:hypothetical protein
VEETVRSGRQPSRGCAAGGFDAAIHGIDEIRGRGQRYRRPPYHSLTDRQLEELAEFLKTHGML